VSPPSPSNHPTVANGCPISFDTELQPASPSLLARIFAVHRRHDPQPPLTGPFHLETDPIRVSRQRDIVLTDAWHSPRDILESREDVLKQKRFKILRYRR
jgi:hypothetical protein